jgi:hypothetical protein
MKTSLEANNETVAWMYNIEDDILNAANQRNLGSSEIAFRAHDGQFYRPLLARQIVYGSGSRNFSVIFVRTLPRKFIGDETASSLLIGLILASRFHFTFIDEVKDWMQKLSDSLTEFEFELSCRQLIYHIERIEQESNELGMNSPDLLGQALGPESHEVVNAFYETWFSSRANLFKII